MATTKLIDANVAKETIIDLLETEWGYEFIREDLKSIFDEVPTVDAVEVVRCKECRWAKPYERTDGETGYYCHFCGHSFKYGTNWERLFTPIKESDDFCSYGER